MTKNEFILQAMISMAGDHKQFCIGFHGIQTSADEVAKAAKGLADAAEQVACFDVEAD